MNKQGLIIAIDGHSSCGKSTVAKLLAKKLKYRYIDTGAMYRAVALFALENGLISDQGIDSKRLEVELLNNKVNIDFRYNSKTQNSDTFLNNLCIEDKIRGIEVAQNVSPIATLKFVRENLVARQQNMGLEGGIIMDGRDIGTAVFPNADLKIFLTADAKIRAERRYNELVGKGDNVTFEEVYKNLTERDEIDSTRKINPLKQAEDAYLVDNSELSQDETFESCMALYNKVFETKMR